MRAFQTDRKTIAVALELFRQHPRRTLIVFACYVLASISEGIGIAALLPILSLAGSFQSQGEIGSGTTLERIASDTLGIFGLQPTIGALLCLLVAALTLKAALVYLATTQAGYATADVAATLRIRLIKALIRARWRFFVGQPVGGLASSMGIDVDNTGNAYSAACQAVSMGIQAILYVAAAILISWQVTTLFVAFGMLLIIAFSPFVRMVRVAGARMADAIKMLVEKLVEGFTGFKAIKAMAREDELYGELSREVEEIRQATRHGIKVLQLRTMIEEPAIATAIAIGLYFYIASRPVGFEALVLMVGLFYRGVSRLTMLQKHYGAVAQLTRYYRNLTHTIITAESDIEVTAGRLPPPLIEPITFNKVSFDYGGHTVIDGASFLIEPRKLTVLFGPSGSGKSTLVDLLVGLSKPTCGEITISGTPLDEINLRAWRGRIGFVPQEVLLFNQSIFQNVTMHDPTLNVDHAQSALTEAGAWDFVSAMPEGMFTVVGERGGRLSGGQRQRIALARALVRRPELLILDEATAALDASTEREIWHSLRDMTINHTILAITHQPSVLGLADTIYKLDNGRLEKIPRLHPKETRP